MPLRFIFRMTEYIDVPVFLNDGEIRSKNHRNLQRCHQASYTDIVNKRNDAVFTTPCGAVVNDFVPFYFSPITSMAYTIHRGNVPLISPTGEYLKQASMDDRVFFICKVQNIFDSDLEYYFTDTACNRQDMKPNYCNDRNNLEAHVNWLLFDEPPIVASIPEIGYSGVTRCFFSDERNPKYANRAHQRMAEFLIRNALPLNMVSCIITKNENVGQFVTGMIQQSNFDIPVYVKPGCYF